MVFGCSRSCPSKDHKSHYYLERYQYTYVKEYGMTFDQSAWASFVLQERWHGSETGLEYFPFTDLLIEVESEGQ